MRFIDLPRDEALRAAGNVAAAATTAPATAPAGLSISRLESREVFDSTGDKIGTIGRVLVDQKGSLFFVLERGGLLGRKRLLSIDRLAMAGDRLIVPGITDMDLRKMSDWDERMDQFAPVATDSSVQIRRHLV